ncbi:hypothetical protein CLI70_01365 [Prevotella intermedia]|nr:hypothetical protein CLI70_01365 [Prevotella intermedia]
MRKIYLFLFAISFTLAVSAQVNGSLSVKQMNNDGSNGVLRTYMDSLFLAKNKIFNEMSRKGTAYKGDVFQLARLFLPTTYYKDIVSNAFALKENDAYSKQLLDIYLHRPSLVKTTDDELRGKQTTTVDVEMPIQQNVEIVDKVAPLPVESTFSPVEVLITKPDFWNYKGDYALQLLQNYVSSNWHKGGESNYSVLSSALLEANYNNKQKVKWDNRLELKFGIQSSKSDSLHSFKTTEDLIRLTSKFGLQATKRWYYSVQFVGYTQFTHSYRSNDPSLYSDILAPLNINLSLGMDYTLDWLDHKLKGNVHLAPLAYNVKYTRLKNLAGRLGIEEGKHARHDFGSELTVDFEWKLMDALTWKTRLYAYATYKRTEFQWENTIKLQFNRYIGAQLFIYPRFDDGVKRDGRHGYWQLKEFASIGFQYSF